MPGSNSTSVSDIESLASIEPVSVSKIAAADPYKDRKSNLQGKSLATRLFLYAQDQREEKKPPWFQEYGILHRMNIADVNNKLAVCKRDIYLNGAASDEQMERLRGLLNAQGKSLHEPQRHPIQIDKEQFS